MEHRGRELTNLIAMLRHGMRLPEATEADRHQWAAQIADARRNLEALYAGGLRRNFLHRSPRPRGAEHRTRADPARSTLLRNVRNASSIPATSSLGR
jgi:hypothetical protein